MNDADTDLFALDRLFSENVREAREALQWSQGELARRMRDLGWSNFHQTTVSRIEKNERPVRLSEAKAIARTLNTPVSVLMAPSKRAVALQRFAETVAEARDSEVRVVAAIQEYKWQRTLLDHELEEVQPLLGEGWLAGDDELRELVEHRVAAAQRFLARDPQDVIEEGLAGPSTGPGPGDREELDAIDSEAT